MANDSEDAYSGGSTPSSSSSTNKKVGRGMSGAGKSMSSAGQSMMAGAQAQAAAGADRQTPMYHKGGSVRKTGNARLLKGEVVIPRSKAAAGRKLLKSRKKGRKTGSR